MPLEPLAENQPNPQLPQQPSKSSPLKQIRTFQGDVAAALSRQKESLFSIQQTERLKQGTGMRATAPAERAPRDAQKTLLFLAGSFLLLAFAGVGGWYTYGEFIRKTAPPTVTIPVSQLLVPESSASVDVRGLSRDTFFAAAGEASARTPAGTLRHLVVISGTSTVTTADLLEIIQSQAPSSLVRAFDPIFMLGTLGESRFLLIKLVSFSNAFGGMLSWETDMPKDLSGLFLGSEILKTISSSSVFTDIVYKNKDARVISASSTPALLYSFFDNDILIITDRPETLQALLERLTREKLVR